MFSTVLLAAGVFAQMFAGSWMCGPTHWNIASAPGGTWTTVRWGSQHDAGGGTAYVGYLPQAHHWVYEDFHYDGSFAMLTSAGPKDDVWTWAGGGYYTATSVSHGIVKWKLSNPTRIDRSFVQLIGGKPGPSTSDSCMKISR